MCLYFLLAIRIYIIWTKVLIFHSYVTNFQKVPSSIWFLVSWLLFCTPRWCLLSSQYFPLVNFIIFHPEVALQRQVLGQKDPNQRLNHSLQLYTYIYSWVTLYFSQPETMCEAVTIDNCCTQVRWPVQFTLWWHQSWHRFLEESCGLIIGLQ